MAKRRAGRGAVHATGNSGVFSQIDKTWRTDLRLKFDRLTDSDGVADYVSIYNAQEAYPPVFAVTYYVP